MAALNPYLNFDGKTEEAFNFYKSVFGGEFAMVMKFKDVPPDVPMGDDGCGGKMSEEDANRIMHIALPIGHGTVLMASDSPSSMPITHGNGYWISISADTKDEADKLFNGLSAGGNIMMPMEVAFWGSYFGMFTDKFGINWMVSFDKK